MATKRLVSLVAGQSKDVATRNHIASDVGPKTSAEASIAAGTTLHHSLKAEATMLLWFNKASLWAFHHLLHRPLDTRP